MRTDGSAVTTGEALTIEQWDALPPGQLTVAGAKPTPHAQLPRLTELWRALQQKP